MPKSNHPDGLPLVADNRRRFNRRRLRIILLALATTLMFALLFVQSAFNTLPWFRPSSVSETVSLYVLSTINFLAFIILLMVLVRNIIKLRRERLEKKLGARFKTRIVVFFIALSLLPVTFLFFATTGLINRSMDKWFSLPSDQMLSNAIYIQSAYVKGERDTLNRLAASLARVVAQSEDEHLSERLATEADTQKLILAQVYNKEGDLVAYQTRIDLNRFGDKYREGLQKVRANTLGGAAFDAEVANDQIKAIFLIAGSPLPSEKGGALIISQQVPQNFADSVNQIRELEKYYESLKNNRRWFRNTALQTLALITLLVLFIAFWLAVYVARGIAEPVQKLVQATERIKSGDMSYRTDVVGDDELAALALSFNEMTAELAEKRRQLEQSAEDLQASNNALDERRRYIEAILQSLSAGVISLDEYGNITTINQVALGLLRIERQPQTGIALEALLPEEQREELRRMIIRAARLRSVTREVHFTLSNQTKLDATVTVTALQDLAGHPRGVVIVIEDLTELIEAQRRAAWSEIARRMAHEIKNPLTPIRLSAERLAKNLLGEPGGSIAGAKDCLSDRQTGLIRECTAMISAEVSTLQRMVDEFSNFARLPNARLEPASLNQVVENTVKLYQERLNGIRLETSLAPELPPVMIDGEQIKQLLVNLIDNAADALTEIDGDRRIMVSTREVSERDAVELILADTGPGISADDRERVFDPYFSTRKRGTGLGLAIVSRIVAEHQGRIRVQDNSPHGARFVVELPAA